MNNQPPADKTARECRQILEEFRQCPPADTLISFHEDELAPGDARSVAAHVGNCPDCARLLEQFSIPETPMMDADYRTAREKDRAEVAKALGFRVERPPTRPLLERISWLWETRVPALVPAAVCAMLFMVILWPAPRELPMTDFEKIVRVQSEDFQTRSAPEGPRTYQATVNAALIIRHSFKNTPIDEGTMVNREISGPHNTYHLEPRSVVIVEEDNRNVSCVEFTISFHEAGIYSLRLSHPEGAFAPVTLKIEILP